jgi:RNA polymerase sigma-70 factor (ECF subfamily)
MGFARKKMNMKAPILLPPEKLILTRYSLLSRLENWGDQASWKDFFDTYWRFIYLVAIKSGLTESEAQDVVQETVISVAKNIHKFKRDRTAGTFRGWLRNIINWRITDQMRMREPGQPAGHQPTETEVAADETDHESMWEEEWQQNLLEAATERVKLNVKEKHYLIFDRCVLKQLPPTEVARTLNVSLAQVYLVRRRVAGLMKKEIQRLEEELL